MKQLTVAFCLMFSLMTFAKPPLDEVKAKIIANLDARIQSMTENKNCIQAAKSHDDLKTCRKKAKEFGMQMREKRKERRSQRKANKKD
jgi:hypothetical protein